MRPRSDLVWQDIDGQLVILDPQSSRYLSVNGAGTALWSALQDGAHEASMPAVLVDRYGIPAEQAEADVRAFVARLHDHGLLEQ